jgi:hypothetical protein
MRPADLIVYNNAMPRRGTRVLNGYVKWILIPLVFCAIGFFIVGPRLSSLPAPIAEKLKEVAPIKSTVPETTESGEPKKTYVEPDVEVKTTPSSH